MDSDNHESHREIMKITKINLKEDSLMGTKGIPAIAGAVLVAMAFEPMTILVKIAYGLFGAAAGSIVGQTIESEAVNVKKQIEEMKSYRDYMTFKKGHVEAEATT
jgi:hypothetical protein